MTLDLKKELHRRAFTFAAGEYLTEWEAVEAEDLWDALSEGNHEGIIVCEAFEHWLDEDIFNGIKHLAKQFVIFHEMEKLTPKLK